MMNLKRTEIIPIAYMPGTGGRFLSNFITAAKNNNNASMMFSPHGNAHENNLLDFPCIYAGINQDEFLKLEYLLNVKGIEGSTPIYYPSLHSKNVDLLLEHFDKVIRITYDTEDIPDLAMIFCGKGMLDDLGYANAMSRHSYVCQLMPLKRYSMFFEPYNSDNVLNISWKELFHLDTNILIDKISSFTSIPKENFNISNLLEWRKLTLYCLDKVSSTLNT